MKLRTKIILWNIAIILVVIGSISALSYKQMKVMLKNQIGDDLLNMANTVAMMKEVQNNIGEPDGSDKIQNTIERIRLKTGVQFIVVIDMNGIRYSHPVIDNIGKEFEGGDEDRVLKYAESYVSESTGTLGESIRAFAPVYKDGTQVGAVCVGVLAGKANSDVASKIYNFIPFLFVGLLLGIIGGLILSYSIKKTIFGLEPEEIAWLLKEKETIFQSIKEGILALNKDGTIKMFNRAAGNILKLTQQDIGRPITDFNYGKKIVEFSKSAEILNNMEIKVNNDMTVMCKYNSLKDEKNNIIGSVISLENLTEIKKMAEELTGIKKMTWSLRAQNHEFMNKLHVISGLIQLGEYDEALKYISNTAKKRKNISNIINEKIKNVSLAALLLSLYNKAEEARINFIIDKDTSLTKIPNSLPPDALGSIIGNIVENSMDAVESNGTGEIKLKIWEENKYLKIKISDNGCGIPENLRDNIYNVGVTSKSGQRGCGMYIVKQIIDEADGSIDFHVNNGTSWDINIPMERNDIND